MKPETNASTLQTEPIDGVAQPPSAVKKKSRVSKAVPRTKAASADFQEGDDVLIKVKHLHGYHATVTTVLDDNQFVVRVNEGNVEGGLFQFSGDQLESLSHANELKKHQNDRLDWNYPE